MTESEGVVTGLDGDYALVVVRKESACGNCSSGGTCGSGLLADAIGPNVYRVANTEEARVGDVVVLAAPAGSLVKAALLSYLGPLLVALVGAMTGDAIDGDKGAIVGVCLGLALGVLLLRGVGRRLTGGKEPMLAMRVKRDVILLHRDTRSS